jgi:hypothetical protein
VGEHGVAVQRRHRQVADEGLPDADEHHRAERVVRDPVHRHQQPQRKERQQERLAGDDPGRGGGDPGAPGVEQVDVFGAAERGEERSVPPYADG